MTAATGSTAVIERWFDDFCADEDQIIMDMESICDKSARFVCGDGTFVLSYSEDHVDLAVEGDDELVNRVVRKWRVHFNKVQGAKSLERALEVFSQVSKEAAQSALNGNASDLVSFRAQLHVS
jgi:hypothetical protein